MERILAALPTEIFLARDGLGWVYQYWQAKRKEEVNASQAKVGADELPPVTQLFTEDYMVEFLLDQTLSRYSRNFTDFRLLDPCCGSGHILVSSFYRLVPLRQKHESLSDAASEWITRCDALNPHVDDDGIVCLPPIRGERAGHERLLGLLIDAWETVEQGSWKSSVLDALLAAADCQGKTIEVWLRDKFFEQHARLFQHRPPIWHVWDGLKDGFSALVNYHNLDNKNLERLIHTYLGDWIRTQEQGVQEGIDGAQLRLSAAKNLKVRLEWVLNGEAPYDIFVRWKALDRQPIGWNPDLNDGVRVNCRPFMQAEVLRLNKRPKLNITWDRDRGNEPENTPWYSVFSVERVNDHHLTLAEKKSAKDANA